MFYFFFFFFQAEDGIRDLTVTGVQTCALPICAQVHDEHRDAGTDHQADGEGLPLQRPDVAQQLPVERSHHESSEAFCLWVFPFSLTIRPSDSEMTRSAIPATAALCVMTAVVVPSSRLTC